jgi:hypothetical protein
LPDAEARIEPWCAEDTADALIPLLHNDAARRQNVQSVRAAGGLRWDATAGQLVEVYRDVCDRLPPTAAALHEFEGERTISEDGLRLLGPGGALPADVERPLLALATHSRLGRAFFTALRRTYQVSQRLRRPRR